MQICLHSEGTADSRVFPEVRIDRGGLRTCDHSGRRLAPSQTLLRIFGRTPFQVRLQFFFRSTTFGIDRIRRADYIFIASYRNQFHRYVSR